MGGNIFAADPVLRTNKSHTFPEIKTKKRSRNKTSRMSDELIYLKWRLDNLEEKIAKHQEQQLFRFISLANLTWGCLIDSGGSGTTIKECNIDGFKCVAKIAKLKACTKETLNGMYNEVNILSKLDCHPNIINYIFDKAFDDCFCVFLTKYQDSLFNFLYNLKIFHNNMYHKQKQKIYNCIDDIEYNIQNPLSEYDILFIAFQIASGINFLHNNNIIHRDIKSSNILVNYNYSMQKILNILNDNKFKSNCISLYVTELVICDFDASIHTNITDISKSINSNGTCGFMPPEVPLSGMCEKISPACDIFSFGMLLVELMTLSEPFEYIKMNSDKHINIQQGKLPDIQNNLANKYKYIVQLHKDCCSYNPKNRPSIDIILQKISARLKEYDEKKN